MFTPEDLLSDIKVEVPEPLIVDGNKIRTTTRLFRADLATPEVLKEVTASTQGKEVIGVEFLGCSEGSEVDQFLATYEMTGHDKKIKGRAVDFNKNAIETAMTGLHTVVASDPARAEQWMRILAGSGMEVTEGSLKYADTGEVSFVVDARRLRAAHDISFLVHNLVKPLPAREPVDLVMLNNVLPHHDLEDAIKILTNSAARLSDKGILSLGTHGFINFMHAAEPGVSRQEVFTTILSDQFDLSQLETDATPGVKLFQRQ